MSAQEALHNPADPSTPAHYFPSQTALLLLDFHSYFVDNLGGSAASDAAAVAASMRTWALSHGIPVIHAPLDTEQKPFPTCKDAGRFELVTKTMKDSGGAREPANLLPTGAPTEDEPTFPRRPGYVSALTAPGLREYLDGRDIKSLLMCGLSTSGCVMRTAMPATDAEYVVTVVSDGCADPKEGLHEVVLELLRNRAYVMSAGEVKGELPRAAGWKVA